MKIHLTEAMQQLADKTKVLHGPVKSEKKTVLNSFWNDCNNVFIEIKVCLNKCLRNINLSM